MTAPLAPRGTGRALRVADEGPTLDVVGRSRRWLRWSTVIISLIAVVLLFGLVAFNALIVRNQGRLDELNDQITSATAANQRLQFEIAELESPERVRATALTALGMIEPETVTYLDPIAWSELTES